MQRRAASKLRAGALGFTLLEVLLAIALMAVAAGMIVPAMVKPVSSELRTAGGRVASVLRRAREGAVNTHDVTIVRFDIEAASLALGESTTKLPEGMAMEVFTARSELESETVGRVRFFPDGSSTGGRITLSMSNRRYMVDVDWLTGRISSLDPDNVEASKTPKSYQVLR